MGVVRNVRRKRSRCLETADAAPETTLRMQGHERGATLAERRRQPLRIDRARAALRDPVTDRARGDVEEVPPGFDAKGFVRGLEERVGTVADHAVARPRRVARVAHVEGAGFQAAAFREMEQAVHRVAPARLLVADVFMAERDDGLRGRRVDAACALVVEVVAQVRADDDGRFRSAPERFEQGVDFGGRHVADKERHQGEPREHPHEEREMHLQAVLALERGVESADETELEGTPYPRGCRPARGRAASGTIRHRTPPRRGPGGSGEGRAARPVGSLAPAASTARRRRRRSARSTGIPRAGRSAPWAPGPRRRLAGDTHPPPGAASRRHPDRTCRRRSAASPAPVPRRRRPGIHACPHLQRLACEGQRGPCVPGKRARRANISRREPGGHERGGSVVRAS